jgi:hypothetical protein
VVALAAEGLRLKLDVFDYLLLALYFATVLGVGFAARRAIKTSADFSSPGGRCPVIVGTIGVFDAPSEVAKAQGVRINLWMGLSMLGLGLLFLAWQWWRPAEASQVPPAAE